MRDFAISREIAEMAFALFWNNPVRIDAATKGSGNLPRLYKILPDIVAANSGLLNSALRMLR